MCYAGYGIIEAPGVVLFHSESPAVNLLVWLWWVGDGDVQAQTETVWRQASRYSVPGVAFINKMDRDGADFDKALATIEKRLGALPLFCRARMARREAGRMPRSTWLMGTGHLLTCTLWM